MNEKIITYGKIIFDPPELTNKHKSQGEWKKTALVEIGGDSSNYYAWLLTRRFNIEFNPPQRGPHVTFINDSMRDLSQGGKLSKEQVIANWESVKTKWDGKEIKIIHGIEPRTDDNHWWLNIPNEDREEMHAIRAELGLGRPFWGLHLAIGIIHPHFIEHSSYIHKTLVAETMLDKNVISADYALKLLNRETERKQKIRKR
jgi:hypothetical protein